MNCEAHKQYYSICNALHIHYQVHEYILPTVFSSFSGEEKRSGE